MGVLQISEDAFNRDDGGENSRGDDPESRAFFRPPREFHHLSPTIQTSPLAHSIVTFISFFLKAFDDPPKIVFQISPLAIISFISFSPKVFNDDGDDDDGKGSRGNDPE